MFDIGNTELSGDEVMDVMSDTIKHFVKWTNEVLIGTAIGWFWSALIAAFMNIMI